MPDVVICVQVRSIRLVPAEKLKLAKSAFLLLMASFKIFTFLAMDYSLYWLMVLIRKHGRFKTVVKAPNMIDVSIEGQGILSDLFRIVVKAFKPFGIKLDVDTTECLPDPLEPDMTAYLQICKCSIHSFICRCPSACSERSTRTNKLMYRHYRLTFPSTASVKSESNAKAGPPQGGAGGGERRGHSRCRE
uniref:Dendritic cell-specific transmembrane protein-like domain-containing protein n=1 Tax=Timema poppense TaxID=170557 RepID=A0A7R9H2N6_TIMPO|nr:unnamed protein product [Timema poppensis]